MYQGYNQAHYRVNKDRQKQKSHRIVSDGFMYNKVLNLFAL
ncbi:hypothetical protein SAMN04488027_105199 [Psychroflexus sediminis]|uniref:Uncharacterized protein n=1 Tax=Psychroflexus sediminis TaxID=470826 RepID=A0A1G7WFT4_9FLAO|nr:hypothetical protein SAMN04488027_105199 [Psychroflexus sediminis]